MRRGALLATLLVALAACSPEAVRARSGGPGADVGNRGAAIQIHGRTDPSFDAPLFGRAIATK